MADYIFRLDKFHIDNTRAWDEDTDVVSFGLKVGDHVFDPQVLRTGDVDNGDHRIGLQFGPVSVPDDASVVFNYTIVNCGHTDYNTVEKLMSDGSKALIATLCSNPWSAVLGGAVSIIGGIVSLLDANCDGPVAADQISATGATLKEWTGGNLYSETRYYPGTDSSTGCGSNSRYFVTWSVLTPIQTGDLLWYRHEGYKDGSAKWTSEGEKIGSGWGSSLLHVFAGPNGAIYGVNQDYDLLWWQEQSWKVGSPTWANNGTPVKIGHGWNFQHLFAAEDGVIYAVDTNNDLLWYRHLGYKDGAPNWENGGGPKKVGTGWAFKDVFAGDEGAIYALRENGDLYWHRHDGRHDGTPKWGLAGVGRKIGSGWGFKQIFPGRAGAIYAIGDDGTLFWYRHLGYHDGSAKWANNGAPNPIGSGWTFRQVFAGDAGTIFALT